jgi:hypothetical protein
MSYQSPLPFDFIPCSPEIQFSESTSQMEDFNSKSMSSGKRFHIFKDAIRDFYEKFFHRWVLLKHGCTREKFARHTMDCHLFTAIEQIT